jgi:hypothetical protein
VVNARALSSKRGRMLRARKREVTVKRAASARARSSSRSAPIRSSRNGSRLGAHGPDERRAGLRPDGFDGRLVHPDLLVCLDERQAVRVEPGPPVDDGLEGGTLRREGAGDDLVGSAIAPQSIDRDTDRHGAEPR